MQTLFSDEYIRTAFDRAFRLGGPVDTDVNKIPEDQFLSTSVPELVDYIYDRQSVDPIVLHEDRAELIGTETRIDVPERFDAFLDEHIHAHSIPANRIAVSIPFTGDPRLWNLRPSVTRGTVRGEIQLQNEYGTLSIEFILTSSDFDKDKIKSRMDNLLENVRFHVESQLESVTNHNVALREFIESLINRRKIQLLQFHNILGHLDIPLKTDPNVPSLAPIVLTRKRPSSLPPVPDHSFQPEPGISDHDYEHILSVIRHGLRTFETTPETCSRLNEEDLRNLLLASLNTHYEGRATSETFRNRGRTDIRIEDDDRAAFVAECKVWYGSSEFQAAIDQLLGYLTWRDCKACIVIFNKQNREFSSIQAKIAKVLSGHRLSKHAAQEEQRAGESRFVFRSSRDQAREITIHALAADLFIDDSVDS